MASKAADSCAGGKRGMGKGLHGSSWSPCVRAARFIEALGRMSGPQPPSGGHERADAAPAGSGLPSARPVRQQHGAAAGPPTAI
jgi:hypothetical protein